MNQAIQGPGAAQERPAGPRPSVRALSRRSTPWFLRRADDRPVVALLLLCGLVSLLTTAGIVMVLAVEAAQFFTHVSLWTFLTDTLWTPLFDPPHFGIMPLVTGTLLVTLGAAAVALPLGLMSAIYLAEYAPERARRSVKPILEVLAGIPTVVYGYFALTFVTPILQKVLPETGVFNAASAAFAMGIMILPMVSSMAEDAMLAVPDSLRHAAYALGATRLEVATRVVVPAATSGITAAFMLAISRATGETMIVTIAAGGTPKITLNPLEGVQTITAYIAAVSQGDTPHGSVGYQTIFAVGGALFLMTLGLNLLARWVRRRYREVYQ